MAADVQALGSAKHPLLDIIQCSHQNYAKGGPHAYYYLC